MLSPKQEEILRQQKIAEDQPGTILRDFDMLLDFVASREIELTGKNLVLPMESLAEINARMSKPVTLKLQRAQQKSYPNINGLYLVLRVTGLARIERRDGKPMLKLDHEAMASWRGLNPTEQYFTLLETWLLRGNEEIIGERGNERQLSECAWTLKSIPDKGLKFANWKEMNKSWLISRSQHRIALMEMFGLISVTHGKPEPGKGWVISRVERKPFGDALISVAQQAMTSEARWEYRDELEQGKIIFNALQPSLQPYFPEWRNTLTLPEPAPTAGLYVFKVSLGKAWRRIAIPSKLTLDDLAYEILHAVNFDSDHLYSFRYRSRFGDEVEVNHPYTEDPPVADEVTIGELPLQPGDEMKFVYDFGDNWQFKIELERIDPPNAKIKKPRVLESHGKAPRQYPDWDDNGDWD